MGLGVIRSAPLGKQNSSLAEFVMHLGTRISLSVYMGVTRMPLSKLASSVFRVPQVAVDLLKLSISRLWKGSKVGQKNNLKIRT